MIKQTGTVTSYKELGEQFLDFVQQSNDTTEPWEVIDDRLDSFYGATIKFPCRNVNKKLNTVDLASIKGFNNFDFIEVSVVPSYDNGHHHYHRVDKHVYNSAGLSYFSLLAHKLGSNDYVSRKRHYYYDVDSSENITVNCFNPQTSSSNVIIAAISFSPFIYLMEIEDVIVSYYDRQIESLIDYVQTNNLDSIIIPFVVVVPFQLLGRQPNGDYDVELKRMMNDYVERIKECNFSYCLYYPTESLFDIPYRVGSDANGHIDNTWDGGAFRFYITSINSTYTLRGYGKSGKTNGTLWDTISYGDTYVMQGTADEIVTFSHATGGAYNNWETLFNVSAVPLGTSSFSDNFTIASSDIIASMENLSFDIYAYISLQYNKITSTTYNEWLTNTKDNYMSESFDSRRRIPAYYNSTETWRNVTISNKYQNNVANIFKDTGEVLFISPHIKYDKNLWMCEQGGIACDQETRTQNIEDNCIRHRKLTSNFSGYATQQFVKVPPFPSLGCPMFTINSSQLAQEKINYYFIRDNNSASIVVYVPTPDSMTYSYVVQHMSFGVLDSFSISEQFMYPLYVCGGNGGLYQEHWSYYSPGSGTPSHEVGNMYKLDMENITMSNSNILLSARFNGANVSNFRVLCPDGHWDNIFNVSQNVSLIVDPDDCYPDSWTPRYYLLQQPVVGGSELGDVRYGGTTTLNGANSIKRIDTGYVIPEYRATQIVDYSRTFHANAVIQPVMPVFSSHKLVSSEGWPRHRYGIIGKIPRCYSTWSRHLKFGELEIGGKKFLSIPSAYDYRIWYPAYKTRVDLANLESNVKSDANTDNVLYNKYIYDYLLLKLED